MGPFRLLDLIGLDVDLAIDRAADEAFGGRDAASRRPRSSAGSSTRDASAASAARASTTTRLRRRRARRPATPARDAGPTPARTPAAIVERLELAVINEAYRAVEDGVALPPVIDEAMRLGAGHPAGPFERVDAIGLRRVVERLRHLDAATAERSGDQYRVAPLLWHMATV